VRYTDLKSGKFWYAKAKKSNGKETLTTKAIGPAKKYTRIRK